MKEHDYMKQYKSQSLNDGMKDDTIESLLDCIMSLNLNHKDYNEEFIHAYLEEEWELDQIQREVIVDIVKYTVNTFFKQEG